ncbi:UNKNOWN [Stylonychia lemnae]|uniref:Uncharacterized protein n=1 Tax=Stylonychia lemnae TaxID=5949 RepID=A0A078ALE7_STYLE|nr:UNKNOWN [Stylonychia lemnae]|eukprot:CDW81683.1 UNKNOWN [Stylonychia lemnae]
MFSRQETTNNGKEFLKGIQYFQHDQADITNFSNNVDQRCNIALAFNYSSSMKTLRQVFERAESWGNSQNLGISKQQHTVKLRIHKIKALRSLRILIILMGIQEFQMNELREKMIHMNLNEIDSIIKKLLDMVCSSSQNLNKISSKLIEYGIYMNISQLLNRIQYQIFEPLLSNILWLLEDLSNLDFENIEQIISTNILHKVFDILQNVLSFYEEMRGKFFEQDHLKAGQILLQCLTVIGNVAAENKQSRKELLKYKTYEIIMEIAKNQILIGIPDMNDKLIWILSNLTLDFNQSDLTEEITNEMIYLILDNLYSHEIGIVLNSLDIIINITNVQPGPSADAFIKNEQVNQVLAPGPLFKWIFQMIDSFAAQDQVALDFNQQELKLPEKIMECISNFLASDDSNIQYLLDIGIDDYISCLFAWNKQDSGLCGQNQLRYELLLTIIMINLCNSMAFEFGRQLYVEYGKFNCILERVMSNVMSKNDRLRKESLVLIGLLLQKQKDYEVKAYIAIKYKIIPTILELLRYEKNQRLIFYAVDILELCLIRDIETYYQQYDIIDHNYDRTKIINMDLLELFFDNDGADVFYRIRTDLQYNHQIVYMISKFEAIFFVLEPKNCYQHCQYLEE